MRKPKQVKIPFKPYFRERLLDGTKTATTRTKRFGRPGDWFPAYGATFTILQVLVVNLHLVRRDYYTHEGFKEPHEFESCWISIHRRKGWQGGQQVYLHLFERTDGKHGTGTGQAGIPFED